MEENKFVHEPIQTSLQMKQDDFNFLREEILILQELAKRVREISETPLEKEKEKLWTMHNDLEETRPLIFADPENGWNEIILADDILCSNALARLWEMILRKQIYWAEVIKDDKVIERYFDVPYCYTDTGWGIDVNRHGSGESGGSYIVIPAITDYKSDLEKLKFPDIVIDYEKSNKVLELAHEIFGDILRVRRKNSWWWSLGMTCDYIDLRGLENLMMDLILSPDDVHAMMDFFCKGYLKRLDWLESNELLFSNNEGTYVGSGGFGWTNQLKKSDENNKRVTTMDMWGFCESQETVGVSPEMFNEFILPYQLKILEKFGLNCYGCCEPIDVRWEYVKNIPRLRRVSASPWSDKNKMAEYLGKDYIMSVKPSPTPLASHNMNEEVVKKELEDILKSAKGCRVELIMKDNHTLGNNPKNISRWVELAREAIG